MQSPRRALLTKIVTLLLVALGAFWAGRASQNQQPANARATETAKDHPSRSSASSPSPQTNLTNPTLSKRELRDALQRGRADLEAENEDFDAYFYTLMEADPEEAFRFLLSLDSKDQRNHILFTSALQMIVKEDPSRALSLLELLPNPRARRDAIQGITFSWGFENPKEALDFAQSHAEGRDGGLWMDVATRWGAEGSPEAIAYLETLEPGLIRTKFMQGLANGMMNRDLNSFIDWYGKLPDHEAATVQKELQLSTNEALNFEQLANFWDVMPPGESREDLIAGMTFATQLDSAKDFRQFVEKAEALEDGKLQTILRQTAIEHFASENPTEAISLMGQVPPQDAQMIAAVAATRLAAQDPDKALDWAHSLTDPAEKNSALFGVLQTSLSDGTETAIKIIEKTPDLLNGQPGEIIIERILEENGDPQKLMTLIEKSPDERGRYFMKDKLLNQWASQDQYGFAEWTNGLQNGSQRDQAVGTLSRELLSIDPDAAMDWSMSMSDETTRIATVQELARDWQVADPNTAQSWLNSDSPLARNVRALLTDPD